MHRNAQQSLKKLIFYLIALLLVAGFVVAEAAVDPKTDPSVLSFRSGTQFFQKNNGYTLDAQTMTLTTCYLGGAKEATYAEIPLVGTNGVGLMASDNITGFKVTMEGKALKASFDKKSNSIKLTTVGLGKGKIIVTGTLKEGKTSTPYIASLDYIVMQPTISAIEIVYKEKGAKSPSYVQGLLNQPMQVGETLAVSVRFRDNNLSYFTYGGGRNAGIWQSTDPGYLSVTPDGKIKALMPPEDNRIVTAEFIDFRGNRLAKVNVTIRPKPNAKLDLWKTDLSFQHKAAAKGSTAQTVRPDGSVTWYLDEGPYQLTTMIKDAKSGKLVKANVFYYSTHPEYLAIDSKGVCYPLKATGSVSVRIYAVGIDFPGIKLQSSFSLQIKDEIK